MKEYKVKRYGRDRRHQKNSRDAENGADGAADRRGLRRRVVFV